MKFEIGDKVEVVGNDSHFDGVKLGDRGVVIRRHSEGKWFDVKAENWGGDYCTFYPNELVKVDDQPSVTMYTTETVEIVPVGSKVTVRPNDNEIAEHYPFVGEIEGYEHFGEVFFRASELSKTPEPQDELPSREQVLEAALVFTKSIFEHYGQQHLDKGTPESLFKAKCNFGFATVVGNALDYEAD